MEPCIQVFQRAIANSAHTSTYKLAWARAIVELCEADPHLDTIHLDQVAERMFASYWNQTIFFDLSQISATGSRAEIVQIVLIEIERYWAQTGTKQPDGFERARSKVSIDVPRLTRVLKKDVSYRFTADLQPGPAPYEYVKRSDSIERVAAAEIAEYAELLHSAINLKWTQVLEDLNPSVPRIANKVGAVAQESDIDKAKRQRGNLTRFRQYLDLENDRRLCFYCGVAIDDRSVSIDHVLPWSYLFHNDLWNLVYAHRTCNSSKSNRVPDQSTIERLKERNEALLGALSRSSAHCDGKETEVLRRAIDEDLVGRFWIGVR